MSKKKTEHSRYLERIDKELFSAYVADDIDVDLDEYQQGIVDEVLESLKEEFERAKNAK